MTLTASNGSEDTRARIVQGAFSALKQNGLPQLSYDMVAAEVGVTRQLVRYYFETSDDLMLALCDYLAGTYRDALLANAAKLEGPERLEMFLDFYFDLIEGVRKPKDDAVYDALMSLATASIPVRENLRGQYSLLGQVLSHEFRLAHPELDARSAEELSFVFVSLMYGHWKMVGSLGASEAHNALTRNAMHRLIRAFVSESAPMTQNFRIWG